MAKKSDMPIVVMIDKTTKLIRSEGALLQTCFQRKEYFLIGEEPTKETEITDE